jgi:hypothetical protein
MLLFSVRFRYQISSACILFEYCCYLSLDGLGPFVFQESIQHSPFLDDLLTCVEFLLQRLQEKQQKFVSILLLVPLVLRMDTAWFHKGHVPNINLNSFGTTTRRDLSAYWSANLRRESATGVLIGSMPIPCCKNSVNLGKQSRLYRVEFLGVSIIEYM